MKYLCCNSTIFYQQGKDIKVVFDRPTALQIDGETIPNVTEYRVTAAGVETRAN